MIPKIIHYVWVGHGDKSDTIRRCMDTWKNHLSDYEIIEWNEDNFDIDGHPFVKEAYRMKKWAFVSDYIRASVVLKYGGIYLDTDVLVLENLDKFRKYRAFVGFENSDYPFTAVFGAEKNHPLLKDMLSLYDNKEFLFDRNNQMAEVNTKSVSNILIEKYNCKVNNEFQILDEDIAVYPDNILCNPSADSSTVHVFTGTWMEGEKHLVTKLNRFMKVRITTKNRARIYNKYIRKGRF